MLVSSTDEPAPTPPRATDGALPGMSRLIVAGYILALVMPLFGLVVGVVLLNRPDKLEIKHGIWITAVSIVAGFVFFLALILNAHGAGSETGS